MQIIAERGKGGFLLIETKPKMGQVWERDGKRLYPEQSIEAILKFGYWNDYHGKEDAEALIASSEPV